MVCVLIALLGGCRAAPIGAQSDATTSAQPRAAASERPNVLFIAIDDLRTELGCYGLDYAQSPNLDRLAAQGILFTNHFVQAPSCGPSRYALLTGRSPHRSGVTANNNALFRGPAALSQQATDGAQSMPELFRRSGYRTVLIGKISHTPDGQVWAYNGDGDGRPELPHAWDECATPYGPWRRGWGAFFAYSGGRHREDGHGHRDLMDFSAQRDADLPDGLMAQRAIEKLNELAGRDEPFFMGLGFYKPHLPFVATRGDWEAALKMDVPPPPHPDRPTSSYWHRSGEFFGYRSGFATPVNTADQITARRAYLACVRFVDRQVGAVLDELDRLGMAENTIVVVWGDHGWHLGDSAIWGKHSPHDRALKSTLMIRAPGVTKPGRVSSALVESIDLYPTLIDLCQPSVRATQWPLDGRSLRPILTDDVESVREGAISYWRRAVSVRTLRHRLIVRAGEEGGATDVELYDISESPDPLRNLAKDEPELVQQLLELIPEQAR